MTAVFKILMHELSILSALVRIAPSASLHHLYAKPAQFHKRWPYMTLSGQGSRDSMIDAPPSSVVSGLQISAANEYRTLFASTAIIQQDISSDYRFLGITTAGAHSDIGGGYKLNGLSSLNFNLMTKYLNGILGEPLIKPVDVPKDLSLNVIHKSGQHKWFYREVLERKTVAKLDPAGKPIEPVNPVFGKTYMLDAKPIGAMLSKSEIEITRKLVGGKDGSVIQPKTNLEYAGKILYATETHLIQQVGRNSAVGHDISKLDNGENLLQLYDNGQLSKDVLKFHYNNDRGSGEIMPATQQRTTEIKTQAIVWATANIENKKSLETFIKHADTFTHKISQTKSTLTQQAQVVAAPKTLPAANKER